MRPSALPVPGGDFLEQAVAGHVEVERAEDDHVPVS